MQRIILACLAILCFYKSDAQTHRTDLDIGNVRAGVHSAGMMFWDGNSIARFEVPKVSGSGVRKSVMFCSALWVAGVDQSDKLRLTTQMYRQKPLEYVSGPLAPGELNQSLPVKLDQLWKFDSWQTKNNIMMGNIDSDVASWPTTFTKDSITYPLAPFTDKNNDGIYDPYAGDEPYMMGNQSIYFVYNDHYGQKHTGGEPVGVQIETWVYGYSGQPSHIDNTVFVRYVIVNRTRDYKEFYATVFSDFDVGNYDDDYIGTDTGRNMIFAYNADDNDEGMLGYGWNPPGVAAIFLDEVLENSAFMRKELTDMVTGVPANEIEFFNLMKGLKTNGNPMTNHVGGNTTFAYQGDPLAGTGWNMKSPNPGEDYAMTGTVKKSDFKKGDTLDFTVAFLYARQSFGGGLGGVEALQSEVDKLFGMPWFTKPVRQPKTGTGIKKPEGQIFRVYPNPSTDKLNVISDGGSYSCRIYSGEGRLVQKTTLLGSRNTINVEGLAPGYYFIELENSESVWVEKFIISR